jgi:transcriptional regulator with XRE-family HTH domain
MQSKGTLALKLRVLRAERALTIEEAAERAGVTPETISDAERGRRRPYLPTLRKLAAGYGVSVQELLEAEDASVPLGEAA